MTPFFFGTQQRRLFGIHQPPVAAPNGLAVLVCNAYGQEAVRLHRLQRVVADNLTRQGAHVMRFDCFATGDAAGEDAEGELDGWTADVLTASSELARRTHNLPQVWLGARLGATLAVRAVGSAEASVRRLLLWEPVLDGAAYLRELARAFVETIEYTFSFPDPRWRRAPGDASALLEREGVGFEIGDRLRDQLGRLTPDSVAPPRHGTASLMYARGDALCAAWATSWQRAGASVRTVELEHGFNWLSEEALHTALVPAAVVRALTQEALVPHG